MTKTELKETLKQDIKDLEGIICYDDYGLDVKIAKKVSKAIASNIKDNLKEFFDVVLSG